MLYQHNYKNQNEVSGYNNFSGSEVSCNVSDIVKSVFGYCQLNARILVNQVSHKKNIITIRAFEIYLYVLLMNQFLLQRTIFLQPCTIVYWRNCIS